MGRPGSRRWRGGLGGGGGGGGGGGSAREPSRHRGTERGLQSGAASWWEDLRDGASPGGLKLAPLSAVYAPHPGRTSERSEHAERSAAESDRPAPPVMTLSGSPAAP